MRTQVYSNKSERLCYGCRACEQICPKNAIIMRENDEGFIYPHIESTLCVECEMCEDVCTTQEYNRKEILHYERPDVYASWNKNMDERLQSTSGGIFYVLARHIINNSGVVYGVCLTHGLTAVHTRVSSLNGLERLRGSKYMQSDTNTTYSQVRTDLNNGIKVLYSGTPCQIAGLRSFLHKEFVNLYTVDVVCHGTPSPWLFAKNIQNIEHKDKSLVVDYRFRNKNKYDWNPTVTYFLKNGEVKHLSVAQNFYGYAFYKSIVNRESCYLCEYSCPQRCSDITLSDFWGAERCHKELKKVRKHGLNMVMCNTLKGKDLFEHITNEINSINSSLEVAIKYESRLSSSGLRPRLRDNIYLQCKETGYDYVEHKYLLHTNLLIKIIPRKLINIIKDILSYL